MQSISGHDHERMGVSSPADQAAPYTKCREPEVCNNVEKQTALGQFAVGQFAVGTVHRENEKKRKKNSNRT